MKQRMSRGTPLSSPSPNGDREWKAESTLLTFSLNDKIPKDAKLWE